MQSCLSPHQPARIVALREDIQPARHLLKTAICMIGRAETCQIQVLLATISRIHAVIKYDRHQGYLLYDNHSSNGVYVNGQRIHEPYRLQAGDEIGLSTPTPQLRFEIAPPAAS
jgi:pSer/pThr/pTyr-binding forkhead associated (FHA) protein